PSFGCGVGGGNGGVEAEVVELADSGVAAMEHFCVSRHIGRLDGIRCLTSCEPEHRLAPGPEVPALGPSAQRPLERVRVRVDESGGSGPRQGEYPVPVSAPAVTVRVQQQLPNALTIARLVVIPIFAALILTSDGGRSWAAAIVFGAAAITDQIDGYLARRWRVEASFGKGADPPARPPPVDPRVLLPRPA